MTHNRIVEENELPGAPSTEWDVNGWGDPSIQGFGHDISIDLGETIHFRIRTDSTDYRIDIYRMGWYAGLGARLVDTVAPSVPLPQAQPEGLRDPATHLYDCGNWAVSASWTAPKDSVLRDLLRSPRSPGPGARARPVARRPFAHPHPPSGPPSVAHAYGSLWPRAASHRPSRAAREPYLLCRARRREPLRHPVPDRRHHLAVLQPLRRALHLRSTRSRPPAPARRAAPRLQGELQPPPSRPATTGAVNTVFNAEYPFVRFLEENGYDTNYTTGGRQRPAGRAHREPSALPLRGARRVLVGGNSGATSRRRATRASISRSSAATRCSGRRASSPASMEARSRTGPSSPTRRPTPTPRSIRCPTCGRAPGGTRAPSTPSGPQPENALTGTIFTVNAWRNDPIIVPCRVRPAPLLAQHRCRAARGRGERAVLLKVSCSDTSGTRISTTDSARPGLFRLSETTIDNVPYVQDCGSVYDSGTATHHLTLYRHESGANRLRRPVPCSGHGASTPTTDTETGMPPETAERGHDAGRGRSERPRTAMSARRRSTSSRTWGSSRRRSRRTSSAGSPRRIASRRSRASTSRGRALPCLRDRYGSRGVAQDPGGGCVAAVEVSVDGGATWHPAEGRRGMALRMEDRRVGHPDDPVPSGRRQREPRSSDRGRHRHRGKGGVRHTVGSREPSCGRWC